MINLNKVIMISGPTGVGKTKTSIQLAKKIDGEIISADSMQIYQEMNIGTAKIREEETEGIKHHLIDVISLDENFTVSDFQQRALALIDDITNRKKVPIIVGGTGLYVNSLLYDMDFQSNTVDRELRAELLNLLEREGKDALFHQLEEIDSKKAETIDRHNSKRVIRAIEIATYAKKNKDFANDILPRKDMQFLLFTLYADRKLLYERINNRVMEMIEDGLVQEVESLVKKYHLTEENQSMKGIGYRQVIAFLEKKISNLEMIEEIKKDSRRYAKRQLTWFRRYPFAKWIDMDQEFSVAFEDILKQTNEFLEG
ncbi:MAG: tRNA (adenosine(37)-N6)-dimethylallyltransferase MiaA [Filifactor alocis]|uniref:tRNA (adenosine(37)-N6)-dimethylallyltransferase MiaA n=1 Tax=Filifactor alocis TaxID=143361 RepID=UPI003F9FE1DA